MKVQLAKGEARVHIRYGQDAEQRRTTTVQITLPAGDNAFDTWVETAICSKKDQFRRVEGRKTALWRLLNKSYKDFSREDRMKLWYAVMPEFCKGKRSKLLEGATDAN